MHRFELSASCFSTKHACDWFYGFKFVYFVTHSKFPFNSLFSWLLYFGDCSWNQHHEEVCCNANRGSNPLYNEQVSQSNTCIVRLSGFQCIFSHIKGLLMNVYDLWKHESDLLFNQLNMFFSYTNHYFCEHAK